MELPQLEKLLNQGRSERKILAFFKGATEKNRQAFSAHCSSWYKLQLNNQRKNWMQEDAPGVYSFKSNKLLGPAVVAAFCCCPLATVKAGGWHTRIDAELIYEALSDRRPDWATAWLENAVASAWFSDWPWYRRLIREGVCDKPNSDYYIRLMIDGNQRELRGKSRKPDVARQLLEDPDLLKSDFWRLFEVPGVMRNGSMTGYPSDRWLKGILELETQGHLDRNRLFRAILATPNMGFNQSQIKFFLTLHDKLRPTTKESIELVKDYVGLLDSALPPVVKWSFEVLLKLDKAGILSDNLVLESFPMIMRTPVKSQVIAGLKWMTAFVNRCPKAAIQTAVAATEGLVHARVDLQPDVWSFIEVHCQPCAEIDDALREKFPLVGAATRRLIQKWLEAHPAGAGQPKTTHQVRPPKVSQALAAAKTELSKQNKTWKMLCSIDALLESVRTDSRVIPPVQFTGMEFKRLRETNALTAIKDQVELIEIASAVIEDSSRFEDAERVLEGICRIPFDGNQGAVAPLIKRMRQLAKRSMPPFFGAGVHVDIIPVLLAWCNSDLDFRKMIVGEEYPYPNRAHGLVGYLGTWVASVHQQLLKGKTPVILATMTHSGGWIDPLILVHRLSKVKHLEDVSLPDQVLSLLRLAPDNRGKALAKLLQLKNLRGEFIDAVAYALGERVAPGKSAPLWVAAARSRSPFVDDMTIEAKFPGLGPDAGLVAQFAIGNSRIKVTNIKYDGPSYEYPKKPKLDFPTILNYQFGARSAIETLDTKPEPRNMAASAATVWPLNRDGYYAERGCPADDLDPLFDPCTPLHLPQIGAIADSMISGYVMYPPEIASAVDLTIASISDGRFDPVSCGRYLANRIDQVSRFTRSLKVVSEASKLHAYQVVCLITELFRSKLKKIPPKISDLLLLLSTLVQELELKLSEETKVTLSKLFAKQSGQAAKLCKEILCYEPENNFDFESIVAEAIVGRIRCGRELLNI